MNVALHLNKSFEQTWFPNTQECFVPSLVEIDAVVLEKKMKMWKVYRQTDKQTDKQTDSEGQHAMRKAGIFIDVFFCIPCFTFDYNFDFS